MSKAINHLESTEVKELLRDSGIEVFKLTGDNHYYLIKKLEFDNQNYEARTYLDLRELSDDVEANVKLIEYLIGILSLILKEKIEAETT